MKLAIAWEVDAVLTASAAFANVRQSHLSAETGSLGDAPTWHPKCTWRAGMERLGALIVVTAEPAQSRTGDSLGTEPAEGLAAQPGWINGASWTSMDDHRLSLATYDLTSIGVLDDASRDSQAEAGTSGSWILQQRSSVDLNDARAGWYECEQLTPGDLVAPPNAEYLYLFRFKVDQQAEEEWNRWYNEEHIPALAAVAGTRSARRFRARQPDAQGRTYLSMYHLESPDLPRTTAWRKAADTEWSLRIRVHHQDRKDVRIFTRSNLERK